MYFGAFLCVLAVSATQALATTDRYAEFDPKYLADIRDSISALEKYVFSPDATDAEINLKHAREKDRDDCLLRVICEISSNDADSSESSFVKNIRSRFGRESETYHFAKQSSSFPYKYAGYVGKSSGSAERCLEVFPVCSLKTETLLALLSKIPKEPKHFSKKAKDYKKSFYKKE